MKINEIDMPVYMDFLIRPPKEKYYRLSFGSIETSKMIGLKNAEKVVINRMVLFQVDSQV